MGASVDSTFPPNDKGLWHINLIEGFLAKNSHINHYDRDLQYIIWVYLRDGWVVSKLQWNMAGDPDAAPGSHQFDAAAKPGKFGAKGSKGSQQLSTKSRLGMLVFIIQVSGLYNQDIFITLSYTF